MHGVSLFDGACFETCGGVHQRVHPQNILLFPFAFLAAHTKRMVFTDYLKVYIYWSYFLADVPWEILMSGLILI